MILQKNIFGSFLAVTRLGRASYVTVPEVSMLGEYNLLAQVIAVVSAYGIQKTYFSFGISFYFLKQVFKFDRVSTVVGPNKGTQKRGFFPYLTQNLGLS